MSRELAPCFTALFATKINHRKYDWPTFKSKDINDKFDDVKKYELCTNCLTQGHPIDKCRIKAAGGYVKNITTHCCMQKC